MTVSFVLNNKQGQVSAETRERVLQAVRDLGYRPTPVTRRIKPSGAATLGLIAGIAGNSLMNAGHSYHRMITQGVLQAADRLGHSVTVFPNSLMHAEPRQQLRTYADGRCDGLLVIAPHVRSPLIEAIEERGFPCVVIGDTPDNKATSFVDVDNVAAGYAMTEYMIGLGHRRIAFLHGVAFVRSAGLRLEGYQQAMLAAGLAVDPAWIVPPQSHEAPVDWLRSLRYMSTHERPTALVCWNDGLAIEVLRRLRLRVPQDISIVGFDDLEASLRSAPPLTTFRQPMERIGERSVEILMALIHGEAEEAVREYLPFKLMERDSVGPPPLESTTAD